MKKNTTNYLLEEILSVFKTLPIGKVLDLGCGDGDYALRLKELGFEVVASDIDTKRFQFHNLIEFVPSNLDEPLPFAERSFDYVLFLEVIEHIYNPDFVINQISCIIKPKGSLFISTPNILNLGSRLRFLFEGSFDFFREPILDYSKIFPGGVQNMHTVVWRYQEIEYILFKNGLYANNVYTDSMKSSLKLLGLILLPLLKFQSWLKERRALRKGGVDYRRINKILFSKELLFGRHLIIQSSKVQL